MSLHRNLKSKPYATIGRIARVRPQKRRAIARKLPWSRMTTDQRAAAVAAIKGMSQC